MLHSATLVGSFGRLHFLHHFYLLDTRCGEMTRDSISTHQNNMRCVKLLGGMKEDTKTRQETSTLISADQLMPSQRYSSSVTGVLELVNQLDGVGYSGPCLNTL